MADNIPIPKEKKLELIVEEEPPIPDEEIDALREALEDKKIDSNTGEEKMTQPKERLRKKPPVGLKRVTKKQGVIERIRQRQEDLEQTQTPEAVLQKMCFGDLEDVLAALPEPKPKPTVEDQPETLTPQKPKKPRAPRMTKVAASKIKAPEDVLKATVPQAVSTLQAAIEQPKSKEQLIEDKIRNKPYRRL